jgi:hypothetical protein
VSRWAVIVLVVLAMGLTACDAPPEEAFGLSLTSHGTVELRFGRCLGAWSIWVRLAGDDLDLSTRPVWALREDRGSGRAAGLFPPVIVIGGLIPNGWLEVTKLAHPLEPGVRYTVHVDSGEYYQFGFDFSVDELKPGYVLDFTHELVPIEEFPTESACTTRSPSVAS